MNAYCSYLLSPESSLDQTKTHEAIKQINAFIERYPSSDSIPSAMKLVDNLKEKLEQKDYDICKLFYRMESYNSAITAFENLLKNYPNTKHREEILFDMATTYYDYAENSVTDKQRELLSLLPDSFSTQELLLLNRQLGINPRSLYRIMNALIGLGLIRRISYGHYKKHAS